MRKSNAVLLAFLVLVLLLRGSAFALMRISKNDYSWNASWSKEVHVTDGKTDPAMLTLDFQVNEAGNYVISLWWLPDGYGKKDLEKIKSFELGFLTSVVIFDEKGREIYATTAGAISTDTTLELSPGTYHADYYYFTDKAAYEEFAKTYLCGTYQAHDWAETLWEENAGLKKEGTWVMQYHLGVSKQASTVFFATGAVIGCLVGGCLMVILLALMTKGKRMESPKYDERQELERGRGYRHAFFVMLLYMFALLFVYNFFARSILDLTILLGFGLILGIAVYAIYCIWHEAYFALNQKATTVMILFGCMGLFNLAIFVFRFLDSGVPFGYHVLNLFCALLFLALFLAIFLKKRQNAHRALDAEEDADEE